MKTLSDNPTCTPLSPALQGPAAGGHPWKADDAGGPPLPAAVVRIRLLGRFTVLRGSQEIPLRAFGGRLPRQLLRLLALRRGALIPKDVIAEALWPRRPPADTRGNIEVLVSRIRRALGDPALIRTGPGGYSLTAGRECWVDTEAFLAAAGGGRELLADRPAEALASFRDALGLWHGEPLAEDTYAEWAQQDRRWLSLALLDALDGAAAAALACGDPAGASTWAERATAREPLRETSAMLAVRALDAGGDPAGAVAAFDSFRDRLAREAGLTPSPEALELRQRIARRQPPPPAPGWPGGTTGHPDGSVPFTGREEERAVIRSAAVGRGPRLILLTGPAGTGKSRLLAEAARHEQVPVLSCRAFPLDRDEPWSLAGRLLAQASRLADPGGPTLPGPEAGALAGLISDLAPPAPGPGAGSEHDRAFTVEGTVRLLRAAARPRCLIVADDLQWADPASLELLGVVLRQASQVSMVAAFQTEQAPAVPPENFGLPAAEVRHLPLGPLPAAAIRRLFSDPVLAEVILEQAGRTPLAATEVVAALAGQDAVQQDEQARWRLRAPGDTGQARTAASAALCRAADTRLAGLPGRWRQLLVWVALLGRPAPPALLAQASGRTLRDVLDCLDGLACAGLAYPGQYGWDLTHPLFGQVLMGTLGPARKARARLLLAQALELIGADPAEIAGHLAAGGDQVRAAAAYTAAAASELERLHDAEAIRLAEAGLGLKPPATSRAQLLEIRAEARRRGGILAGARADLEAALDSSASPAGRSRVLAELAMLEARSVSLARGEELVELAIAEAQDQPGSLGQALAAGAILDLPAGNLPRAGRRLQRARTLLEQAGETRGQARVLYWQAMSSYLAGRLREAAARLADLADLPAAPAEVLRLWSPRATRGHVLALLSEPETGLAEINEALGRAEAARYPVIVSECLWRRSEALAFAGRAGEAAESAEQALAIATRLRHAACTAAALRGLGIAWETAGKPDRAEEAFRDSLAAAEGNPFFAAWASARLGACLARRGRPQDAEAHVRASLSAGPPLIRYEARWAQAELLAALGEDQACRAAAADALRAAEKGGYLALLPRLRELAGL